ncbi:hypothetical protein GCM10027418_20360 [Mariniluteicoccus endophyticus]
MPIFERRYMGRGWAGFQPSTGFAYALTGDAFDQMRAVRDELRDRLGAVAYEHVLSTTRGTRQLLGARALDDRHRCVAWVLAVELDGRLPRLHLSPQKFRPEDDLSLGDATFDRMYRCLEDETEFRPQSRSGWLRAFVSEPVRRHLVTHRALNLTVAEDHLLLVLPGTTSPTEALATFDDEGQILAELADLLPAELYQVFGTYDPAAERGDVPVLTMGRTTGEGGWPVLPQPPVTADEPRWPVLPRSHDGPV